MITKFRTQSGSAYVVDHEAKTVKREVDFKADPTRSHFQMDDAPVTFDNIGDIAVGLPVWFRGGEIRDILTTPVVEIEGAEAA